MKTITVYNYEAYDATNDERINHGRWATMEYINTRNLTAIIEGKLEVSESSLDSEGRYIVTEAKP